MTGIKRSAGDMGVEYDEDGSDVEDSDAPQVISRHHSRAGSGRGYDNTPLPQPKKPRFNIFKAIIRHPNLFFEFALRLPPDTMMDLYAIDKEFHYRLNQYNVSIIHDYAQYHAPDATDIFTWMLYMDLCISDPMLKPMDGRPHLARDIPSFRWTKLVIRRDKIVREILTYMALDGHRVPKATIRAVMKYWVLMELNKQTHREAFIQSLTFWTDSDIILFQLFLAKLDMQFSDPVQGNGTCCLSHLLLMQPRLTPLWKVLGGKPKQGYDDVAELAVQAYDGLDLNLEDHFWLNDEFESGIPPWEWGMLSHEEWKENGAPLDPALELVILEGIKRGLHVQQYYLDFVLYGYVDMDTGENIPVPRYYRGDEEVVVPAKGYPSKAVREELVEESYKRYQ